MKRWACFAIASFVAGSLGGGCGDSPTGLELDSATEAALRTIVTTDPMTLDLADPGKWP